MGSLVYAGIVITGLIGAKIFIRYQTKNIVITSILGCILSLMIFPLVKIEGLLFLSRILTGSF
jgi:hypothetical protein